VTISLTSRHQGLTVHDVVHADGVSHPTIGLRPVAPPSLETASFHHIMTGAESIEYLAWRYFGMSEAWWRIADANRPIFPLDLPAGSLVAIPEPSAVGRVERNRIF
jgi:hypothetical protein